MKLNTFLAGSVVLTAASAKLVTGIFTGVTSLTSNGNAWTAYRRVVFKWSISSGQVLPGDVFVMETPCIQPYDDFNLEANGNTYAKCSTVNNGTANSIAARCVATDVVLSHEAFGTVSVPIYVGLGGQATSLWYSLAHCSKLGNNQLTFTHGDQQWKFTNYVGPAYPEKHVATDSYAVTLTGLREGYALEKYCKAGYKSGTLKLELTRKIDCSTVQYGMTSEINEFYFPKSGMSIAEASIKCTTGSITLTYKSIPAGYRPFLWTIFDTNGGREMTQTGQFTCADSSATLNSKFEKYINAVAVAKYIANGIEIKNATTSRYDPVTSTTTILKGTAVWTRVLEVPYYNPHLVDVKGHG